VRYDVGGSAWASAASAWLSTPVEN